MSIGLIKQAILRALHNIIESRIPDIIIRPLVVIILILFFHLRKTQLDSCIIMLFQLTGILAALSLSIFFVNNNIEKRYYKNAKYKKSEWHSVALPLLLISGIFSLLNYVDTIMIGIMSTSENVAIYSLATRFATLVLFILQSFNIVIAPKISEYYSEGNNKKLQEFISLMSKIMFFTTIPILLFLIFFGHQILKYFGPYYEQGYTAMILLALGQTVNVSFGPIGFLLSMTKYQKLSFKIIIISLLINFALNVPGIYFFNIIGAACATTFSIIIRNYLMWRSGINHLKINSFALR